MRKLDFWTRMVSLLAAVLAVGVYQAHALQWQAETEENRREIAAIEAKNAAAQSGTVDWSDGVYFGEGEGFGGTIRAQVTVVDGEIQYIELVEASGEDAAYLDKAMGMIDTILDAQSTEVDTVSGATFSSTGIRDAVTAALKEAEA